MTAFGIDAPPAVTIVTVVYNGAPYLERTINSVLALSYPRLSYIVIDGGSTDGTVDVIRRYADRISFWISEPDRGIYDAMNKAWSVADPASYVLFLGAGDEILSLPAGLTDGSSADVICGRVLIGDSKYFLPRIGARLKLYNTLHHQALLVKKALHPAPPFDTAFRVYADFDFNQRLYKRETRFVISEDFVAYAMAGGISQRYPLRESLRIVRKNFGVLWALLSFLFYLYNSTKVAVKTALRTLVNRSSSCTAP